MQYNVNVIRIIRLLLATALTLSACSSSGTTPAPSPTSSMQTSWTISDPTRPFPNQISATLEGETLTVTWGPIPSELPYENGMYEVFVGQVGFNDDGNPAEHVATCRVAASADSCVILNVKPGAYDIVVYATSTDNQSFWTPSLTVSNEATSIGLESPTPAPAEKPGDIPAACDHKDQRISKYKLPQGPLEAQVAAACVALEWEASALRKSPEIKIFASPNFSKEGVNLIKRSVMAGMRLVDRFSTHPGELVYVIASADPEFSCKTGKRIVDPLLLGSTKWRGSWAGFPNSGCSPSDHPGGGYASTIGSDAEVRLGWMLATPEMVAGTPRTGAYGDDYLWSLTGFDHEFVHTIQDQISGAAKGGGIVEPGWFGEGQADFIGWMMVPWLEFGDVNYRKRMREDLMRWAPKDGAPIDFREIRAGGTQGEWADQLMYVAGRYAIEYLIAHYGYEASWSWWKTWNSGICAGDAPACTDKLASSVFGLSAAELYRRLNTYVNTELYGIQPSTIGSACDVDSKESRLANLPKGSDWRAATAASCIVKLWNTKNKSAPTVEILAPDYLSEQTKKFVLDQANIGVQLFGTYVADSDAKITFILPDNPKWLCATGQKYFRASEFESEWDQSPWSGCQPTLPGPHSWSGWSEAIAKDCDLVSRMVNQPGAFTSGPRKGERFVILSQCTPFLKGLKKADSSWGLRKMLQANTDTYGPGHQRYWFESGWEAIVSGYGGALAANTALATARPWVNQWDKSVLKKLGGKLPSIAEYDRIGNGAQYGDMVLLTGVQMTLAAEYVMSGWGPEVTYELIDQWADTDDMLQLATITKKLLGIPESALWAAIDAYIKRELRIQ